MNFRTGAARLVVRWGRWSLVWLLLAPLSWALWVWFVGDGRSPAGGVLLAIGLPPLALSIAPYGLAATCAAISAWFAIKALALLATSDTTRNGDTEQWIRRLGWLQFEQLVDAHYTHRGLRTVLLQGLSRLPPRLSVIDGSGGTILIHYDEWKTVEVGYEIVQAFVDEIATRSAQSGQLLTFGRLTRGAASLASTHHIEVVCGERLIQMLRASGWDSSRFRESGASTGFGNSRSADSGSRH